MSSGEWRRGRDVLVKGVLSSTQAGGKRTTTVETVRFLTPDAAIVDARYEIVGGAYVERRMWSSFIMARVLSPRRYLTMPRRSSGCWRRPRLPPLDRERSSGCCS